MQNQIRPEDNDSDCYWAQRLKRMKRDRYIGGLIVFCVVLLGAILGETGWF